MGPPLGDLRGWVPVVVRAWERRRVVPPRVPTVLTALAARYHGPFWGWQPGREGVLVDDAHQEASGADDMPDVPAIVARGLPQRGQVDVRLGLRPVNGVCPPLVFVGVAARVRETLEMSIAVTQNYQ